MKPKLTSKLIEKSKADIRRDIHFPEELTKNLAELIGVIIGDGHLRYSIGKTKRGTKFQRSDIIISGNIKEKPYLNHVNKLFKSLFNLDMFFVKDNRSNAVILRAHSRGLVLYLSRVCEIPISKKSSTIKIPKIIKESNNTIKCAFLKGLADTDFSLIFQNKGRRKHDYPLIKGSFRSKKLVKDLEILFKEMGFKYSTYYDEKRPDKRFKNLVVMHNIYLYGVNNLYLWIKYIGFSNLKFCRKIKKYIDDGHCPPGY